MSSIHKQAKSHARRLLADAHSHEPQITADLQKIASEFSAEIPDLEHKFKTVESLAQKLADKTIIGVKEFLAQGFSQIEAIEKSLNMQAELNNDALRYTFVVQTEKYVFSFKHTLNRLKNLGYEVVESRIWKAWKNIGMIFDKGYRGINTTIISSQWQKFELQFHTEESFQLKMKTHNLYKEARLRETSKNRRAEIAKIMIRSAKEVSIPQGVKKL